MCELCPLSKHCDHPSQSYVGKGSLGVLIIDDAPDLGQDSYGLDYGEKYTFLKKVFKEIGVDIEQDLWYTTTLGCYNGSTRKKPKSPTLKEVQACTPRLSGIIDELHPNVLILLGEAPFSAVITPRIRGRLTGTKAGAFYGETIPDQEYQMWLCPTWDLQTLFQTVIYEGGKESAPFFERDKAVYKQFRKHLFDAVCMYDTPVTKVDYASLCHTTQDIDMAIDWIAEAMVWEEVAFDIETTGIKPYRKGHEIISVAISNGEISYAFPFFDDTVFKKMFRRLMLSSSKKIAHNIQYEGIWIRHFEGYWFENWYFDTMLAMHCLHNLKPTGLKYCTYKDLGVIGYDDSADMCLKAVKKEVDEYGDNAINKIKQCPIDDLLLYNALDSLFTFKLKDLYVSRFESFQMEGFEFFMESARALAHTSYNGFNLNMEGYRRVTTELEGKLATLDTEIRNSPEVELWDGIEFNYNSNAQLGHLLFDILQIESKVKTASGAQAVNIEALEGIDHPFVRKILEYRKYTKLLGTYIHQYKLESTDGMCHPFFYLNRVETFRSSCGSPNLQNIPKRDDIAKNYITSLVMPRKGHKIISYDYKSLEVLINACHSGDKTLIEFTSDPSKDMHRSFAADTFMLAEHEVTKSLRTGTKGQVFATFYGSYYKQIAPDCWDLAQKEGLIEHLANKGADTFDKFQSRVKAAEEIMWTERFPTHDKWRKQQWKDYQKQGYLDTYTGFRLQCPMRRNNTFNSPVQGDGYHVLQWAYNQVLFEIEKRGLEVFPFAEIHDAGDYSCHPRDEEELDELVRYYYTEAVKVKWPWIVVNLQVEKEAGEIEGDWSTLKAIKML